MTERKGGRTNTSTITRKYWSALPEKWLIGVGFEGRFCTIFSTIWEKIAPGCCFSILRGGVLKLFSQERIYSFPHPVFLYQCVDSTLVHFMLRTPFPYRAHYKIASSQEREREIEKKLDQVSKKWYQILNGRGQHSGMS